MWIVWAWRACLVPIYTRTEPNNVQQWARVCMCADEQSLLFCASLVFEFAMMLFSAFSCFFFLCALPDCRRKIRSWLVFIWFINCFPSHFDQNLMIRLVTINKNEWIKKQIHTADDVEMMWMMFIVRNTLQDFRSRVYHWAKFSALNQFHNIDKLTSAHHRLAIWIEEAMKGKWQRGRDAIELWFIKTDSKVIDKKKRERIRFPQLFVQWFPGSESNQISNGGKLKRVQVHSFHKPSKTVRGKEYNIIRAPCSRSRFVGMVAVA